jgi:hypothetical protein
VGGGGGRCLLGCSGFSSSRGSSCSHNFDARSDDLLSVCVRHEGQCFGKMRGADSTFVNLQSDLLASDEALHRQLPINSQELFKILKSTNLCGNDSVSRFERTRRSNHHGLSIGRGHHITSRGDG